MRAVLLGAAALVAALVLVVSTATARRAPARSSRTGAPATPAAVPQGFVGVDVDGPLIAPGSRLNLSRQMTAMVRNGVQTIRIAFNWAAAQPYQSWSQVPAADRARFTGAAGRPVDFHVTDAIMAAAARHRLAVLPTVLYAPAWDGVPNRSGVEYPSAPGPYAAYLSALIGRYGPHGSFWRANPSLRRQPIREWQIWNEPNLLYYWRRPFAPSYVGLLRAAHAAVKRADPGAKVVLGALTNRAWAALSQIYRNGGRRLFDVAAVNGFTKQPAAVITYLRYMRRAMARGGDARKPLLATEVSWPSAQGRSSEHYDFNTTERGQARNIAALLPMLGAERVKLRLAGFDYYTWMGDEDRHSSAFDFSGLEALRGGRVHVKPALAAFRTGVLRLERCTRKGAVATACVR